MRFRGGLVVIAAAALLVLVAIAPTARRHRVTEGVDLWFARHYPGAMPNECDRDPVCFGGGSHGVPEQALRDTVDAIERTCRANPDVAILLSLASGPPGSDFTRRDIRTRGVIEALVARETSCRIQVETRAELVQLSGNPWQPGLDPRYNRSAAGCPHGTISHHHSRSPGDRECGWPSVGAPASASTPNRSRGNRARSRPAAPTR